jgi:UDP-N-acetylmuramate--alanine ligase
VLCADDANLRDIVAKVARPVVTYGIDSEADVRAIDIVRDGQQSRFTVLRPNRAPLPVSVNLPGRHNVLNSLAAIAVATELSIDDAAIQRALAAFQGIERRLQQIAVLPGNITIVDDYGHHPTEIAATLDAVRQGWPNRRLVLAFQPHRYTRTRDLIDDFAQVLTTVDALLVTEVYAAGEPALAGADGRAICRAVRSRGQVEPVFVEQVTRLDEALRGILQPGDVLLTMGAGNIGAVAHELPARLASGEAA